MLMIGYVLVLVYCHVLRLHQTRGAYIGRWGKGKIDIKIQFDYAACRWVWRMYTKCEDTLNSITHEQSIRVSGGRIRPLQLFVVVSIRSIGYLI